MLVLEQTAQLPQLFMERSGDNAGKISTIIVFALLYVKFWG